MKQLPQTSGVSYGSGIWYIFHQDDIIIRVWLSLLNGKEHVYINDELLSKKLNITSMNALHHFSFGPDTFEVEIRCENIMLMELQCAVFRNGQWVGGLVNRSDPMGRMSIEQITDSAPAIARMRERLSERGIALLGEYDVQQAIKELQSALNAAPDDPEVHFHLACAYSLEEKTDLAFDHLQHALDNGLQGRNRILQNDKLAFIRIKEAFEAIKKQL